MATFKFTFVDETVQLGKELANGGWEGFVTSVTVDIEVSNIDMDYQGNPYIDEFDIKIESLEPCEGCEDYNYEGLNDKIIQYVDEWAYDNITYQMGDNAFEKLEIDDYVITVK
jgi:hypothetical protein